MLLQLGNSIENIDLTRDRNSVYALDNILLSEFEGKNIVFAEQNIIDFLKNNIILFSGRASAVVGRLDARYPEKASLANSIDAKVIIQSNINDVSHDGSKINVPLVLFEDRTLSDSTVLLGENLDDAKIYKYSGEHYRILNHYQGTVLSLKPRGGGGSTTSDALEQIINSQNEMCLTIVDSDKHSPYCCYGDTAQACLSLPTNEWVSKVFCLEGRMLENVLPIRHLRESVPVELESNITEQEAIYSDAPDVYQYINIKNGTTFQWICKKTERDQRSREYWLYHIQSNESLRNRVDVDCLGSASCSNENACTCHIFTGLTNAATHYLTWLDRRSSHKSAETIKDCSNWLNIGKNVYEWCCAVEPYRI
ncbi:MAG: hypothetical protein QM484_14885 [Woeseiaceae bacterium]